MNLTAKNPKMVKSMFASVAQNYDCANSVLSMGIHHVWRTKLVNLAGTRLGQKVLDCATGTGDLAIAFKKVVGATGEVIGTDFCEEMLALAPKKALSQGLDIKFQLADVMNLPFLDNNFDCSSISFGIRNVADPRKGLAEMARVVKPGGKVIVLEFGQVDIPIVGTIYNWYSQKLLPKIGGWVTGQPQAYEYLQKSSAAFPCREEFCRLMKSTGSFAHIEFHSLSFGIAYIYVGVKI
jgi:demethylmenaquinone methyltransferase/2-methoxy-6-polyprenyl-1,4-benzoquinol methylase